MKSQKPDKEDISTRFLTTSNPRHITSIGFQTGGNRTFRLQYIRGFNHFIQGLDKSLEAMGINTVQQLRDNFREKDGLIGHLSGSIPGILAPAGPLGQGQHFAMSAAKLHPGKLFPFTVVDIGTLPLEEYAQGEAKVSTTAIGRLVGYVGQQDKNFILGLCFYIYDNVTHIF